MEQWLIDLKKTAATDGVKILSSELRPSNVAQFFVSTRPETSPSDVVRSVKGRLQYLMADPQVQARLEELQFRDEFVDLSPLQIGTYGQYLNSLQIVLENAGGWQEVREEPLSRIRSIVIGSARKKDWRLSRIGLLSNHLQLLLGAAVTESSQSVALSLMNNIAYVYSMTPVLKFSHYAGTFGGYDRGAIRLHQS